jgi:pyruvate/2-oxoglutarate dehydrogenase complex dihydrolipoamide dehydrogenase (E3) component
VRTFDVIVVGGGPAGEQASARLSDHGRDVALVEDRLVAGECGHWACIPSKALLRPPEVLDEAHRIPGARETVDRERSVLIGCTITGSEVADFLHAATIAVVGEVPLDRLRHAVPPFPTRSELWLSLLEQAGV